MRVERGRAFKACGARRLTGDALGVLLRVSGRMYSCPMCTRFPTACCPLPPRSAATLCCCRCEVVDGLQMFVGQAVGQFEKFTGGSPAPVELMEDLLLKNLGAKK